MLTNPSAKRAVPDVSICIPTYRGSATLAAAIDSVLAQTFTDFELVIIDDGSPDDTPAIVRRYADPRVRYLRNDANLGPEGNWNRCLAEARGRFFKLLPHDDLLYPDCLAQQVRALVADTDERLALVFCARDVLGPAGRVITQRGFPGGREGAIASDEVRGACVRRGTNLLGEPGAVLMRLALARLVGPFDAREPYVVDLNYWFRLLSHGNAHYCAQRLAAFRVSRSSWSVDIGARQARDFRGFVRRMATSGQFRATWLDRFCGRLSPSFNNLARLVFYRLYLE